MMDIKKSCFYGLHIFNKKTTDSGVTTLANQSLIKKSNHANLTQLTEEFTNKPIIRKSKKITVDSAFERNICGADSADIQLISKFNKGIKFLLCVFLLCLGCSFKR